MEGNSGETRGGEYRAAFEASPNAILVVDSDTGVVLDANDTASTVFDDGHEQLRQQSLAELTPQTGDEQQLRREAAETGQAQTEWRLETDDGPRWLDVTIKPADDGTERLFVFCRSVTEQREHEQQLEENNAILSQLTGTTDEVFWLFEGGFSELLFINDAYEDVWGQSIADLEADSMDFMRGVHPADREIVRGAIERLLSGEPTEDEYRVNPDEGFERWVWVRGEPVLDEHGDVKRVAGFARDITARKERERTLERSERQFEAVFNDPQVLVGLLDTDGRIQHINETAFEFISASRDDIEGTPFAETAWWSHDEQLQERVEAWLDRAAAGEYVEFEAEHPLPEGGKMAVEGTVRPVTDDEGTVRSLIVSARDITERKERERQLAESNERLEKFAYVASHDLQEPLRTISNYIELIEEEYADDIDEEAERFIDTVVTGSKRMESMINGLLDYSRVTTRGEEFELVDTEAVVAGAVSDLEVMLEEHDGSVEYGELPTVKADHGQLQQVAQNLVKNALEHSGEGSSTIVIRGEDTGEKYRFEVEDDGPGIESNRQEKIFRIFKSGKQYQTSSQAKGIGLAICDNIVQRHGGEIWVESEPGDGATFIFTVAKHD